MLRFPDIPNGEIARRHLKDMPGWFCKLKIDGWRCLVHRSSNAITYWSKLLLPLDVVKEIREPFEDAICKAFGPEFVLDCELTGNRRAGDAKTIVALEALNVPLLGIKDKTPAYQRWEICQKKIPNYTVPATLANFEAFFDRHKSNPLAEGVVLMKLDAMYIGRCYTPAKNSGIIKCKWRAGQAGTTVKENA